MQQGQSGAGMRLFSSSLRFGFALGAAGVFASGGFAAVDTSKDTYYINDHLASTVAIADAAGEIAQIEADAFGAQPDGVAKDSRFTGKPYDEDMGAYVFPFRNYRPEEARWMTQDPSGFPDGVNGVAYMAIPGMTIDPTGLAVSLTSNQVSFVFNAELIGTTLTVKATVDILAFGNDSPAATATISGATMNTVGTAKLSDGLGLGGGAIPYTGTILTMTFGDIVAADPVYSNNGLTVTQTYKIVATGTETAYLFGGVTSSSAQNATGVFSITHSVAHKE